MPDPQGAPIFQSGGLEGDLHPPPASSHCSNDEGRSDYHKMKRRSSSSSSAGAASSTSRHQQTFPCGVGVLDGSAGAKSRCAREAGTAALCDCGRHTFLIAPPTIEDHHHHHHHHRIASCPPSKHDDVTASLHYHHHRHYSYSSSSSSSPSLSKAVSGDEHLSQSLSRRGRLSSSGDVSISRRLILPEGGSMLKERGGMISDIENITVRMVSAMTRDSSNGIDEVEPQGGGPAALPLDRIVVESNGDMLVLEPSVVCDACPACDDVCSLENCRGCDEKRQWLGLESSPAGDGFSNKGVLGSQGVLCLPGGKSRGSSFTLCEVRRHRTLASCWLVAKGHVYDATSYLSSHPAGAIAIARKAGGRDCTEDLEFHSVRAQKLWKHLRIGTVRPCPTQQGTSNHENVAAHASLVGSSCSVM